MPDEVISFTINGLEELVDFLTDKAPNAIKDTLNEQLQSTRDEIESTTTQLCPVDTGALRDSIDITVSDFTIFAVAGMEYASYVDGGTRYMDAQPFFENPINDILDDFANQLEEQLASSLENI